MKKISLFLVAAVASSAAMASAPKQSASESLLEKQQLTVRTEKSAAASATVKADIIKNGSANVISKAPGDVTLNDSAYVSPLMNFSTGITTELRGYLGRFGILPSKGNITFSALETGAKDGVWTWDNGLKEPYHEDFTTSGLEASIELKAPSIISDVVFTPTEGNALSPLATDYFVGVGGEYWGMEGFDEVGATLYPLNDGGMREKMASYASVLTADGLSFTKDGACVDWIEALKDDERDEITDIQINGFSQLIPAQSSPYLFTKSWLWANVNFTAATELTMKVYTIETINNQNIISADPIAIGHAPVAKQKGGMMIEFEIFPVDEDGDEIDGVVAINNTPIFMTLEGFNGNPAVEYIFMVYGNGTECVLPTDGSRPTYPWVANAMINVDYKYNGEEESYIGRNPYNYYTDATRTALWIPSNYFWMIDAKFPYLYNVETETDEFNYVVKEREAGELNIEVDSYYYITPLVENDLMSYSTESDWVTVELGEPDRELGISPIKVSYTAMPDGVDVRYAEIKFTGYAQDFTINIEQGEEGSGVNIIGADGAKIEYFDLQGRKLNSNPEKGVYILKQGNKTSKVIL